MKKNSLFIAAAVLAGVLVFGQTNLPAQNQTPLGAPPGVQTAPPGAMRPRPRGSLSYRGVILNLKRAKDQLERDTNDYDGHRQAAIDACDKAMEELQAVQSSIDAARKAAIAAAKAAAAEQAQTNQPPPSTAPAVSPTAPQ
jgi:hypothetical protein